MGTLPLWPQPFGSVKDFKKFNSTFFLNFRNSKYSKIYLFVSTKFHLKLPDMEVKAQVHSQIFVSIWMIEQTFLESGALQILLAILP